MSEGQSIREKIGNRNKEKEIWVIVRSIDYEGTDTAIDGRYYTTKQAALYALRSYVYDVGYIPSDVHYDVTSLKLGGVEELQ